jgi:hypothetical protein
MPIPSDHLRRLEADLSGRERWLDSLRLKVAGLQDEVFAHETILALARDPEILLVLHELHDRPELGEQIARDPKAFFEERGVRLLEGAIVTVVSDPERSAIEARFRTPTLNYGVGWSRRRGFYLVMSTEDIFVANG